MAKYDQAAMDRTFGALSDATRRAILGRLGRQPGLSMTELAEPFAMQLPAVMKHLTVLVDAGLVSRSKSGRTTSFELAPMALRHATRWLLQYERFWSTSLDRLARMVEER